MGNNSENNNGYSPFLGDKKPITFHFQMSNPWDMTVEYHEVGGMSYVKADKETRDRQLKEYKEKRIAELEEEIRRVRMLF